MTWVMKVENRMITGNALNLFRISEAAKLLGVSEKCIRSRISRGELPHYRMGWLIFIHRDDLMPPRIASRAEILG
jgi:excisionase family DNA binding protein